MDGMDDLVQFLRDRYDEEHAALLGHPGPCLNFKGQDPKHYDEYDSCYLHIEAVKATPYSDATFGLIQISAMRQTLELHRPLRVEGDSLTGCTTCSWRDEMDELWVQWPCPTIRLHALPYFNHPDYREEWQPPSI